MGFFSGISRAFKKVFKGVTKVVKKVTKGISKLAKKVVKGVKGLAKKINKLGPLAAIAIGFFVPPLGTGIWGAMAKGALTGFISSGGSIKGALLGAAGGGLGYGMSQGLDAFKGGWNSDTLGANATFTQKLTSAFDAVGTSTSNGVAQMYNSTAKYLKTGDLTNFDSFDYLTDSGAYRDTSLNKTNLFEPESTGIELPKDIQRLERRDEWLEQRQLNADKAAQDELYKKKLLADEEIGWEDPALQDTYTIEQLEAQDYASGTEGQTAATKSKYDFNNIANALGKAINMKDATTVAAAASPYAVTSVEGLDVGEGGLGDFSGRGSRSMNIGDFRLGVFGGGDYSLLANKAMRLS
jgi:hypothetical protein